MASSTKTPPTPEEIAAEIVKLTDVKPRVRRENIMREDNHLKIETEIALLTEYPLHEMRTWPDDTIAVLDWLTGKNVPPPSAKWERMAIW